MNNEVMLNGYDVRAYINALESLIKDAERALDAAESALEKSDGKVFVLEDLARVEYRGDQLCARFEDIKTRKKDIFIGVEKARPDIVDSDWWCVFNDDNN